VTKDVRRHHRVPYIGPVQISWESADGNTRYAQGKCVDLSEGGLRVEVSHPVPVRTNVSLRADRIKLAGSAWVKHSTRHGARYILGLELSQVLTDKALTAVREPWALRTPAYTG
jgi:PilZ domain